MLTNSTAPTRKTNTAEGYWKCLDKMANSATQHSCNEPVPGLKLAQNLVALKALKRIAWVANILSLDAII